MKRLGAIMVVLMSLLMGAPAFAGSSSGSINVSVVVLPPTQERISAPMPTQGFGHTANQNGDNWIVPVSASVAVATYQQQLRQAGYAPVGDDALHWSNGSIAVMISAKDAISSTPISRLTVMAYDIQRQQARLQASHPIQDVSSATLTALAAN